MFYVLFTYSKGRRERDFRGFRSEDKLIEFLHENYEKIDIVQIIGVERSYRLGLIETAEVAKSALILQDIETDLPDLKDKTALEIPEEAILSPEEMTDEKILKKNKAALKRADEAMDAARKDLEKTEKFIPKPDDEKAILDKADRLKAAGEKSMEEEKKGWVTCPDCNKNKMAPWNKSGRCSECQQYKKKSKKK